VGGAQLRVVAHRIDHRLDLAQRAHGRIDAVGVAARAAARRQASTAWMPARVTKLASDCAGMTGSGTFSSHVTTDHLSDGAPRVRLACPARPLRRHQGRRDPHLASPVGRSPAPCSSTETVLDCLGRRFEDNAGPAAYRGLHVGCPVACAVCACAEAIAGWPRPVPRARTGRFLNRGDSGSFNKSGTELAENGGSRASTAAWAS